MDGQRYGRTYKLDWTPLGSFGSQCGDNYFKNEIIYRWRKDICRFFCILLHPLTSYIFHRIRQHMMHFHVPLRDHPVHFHYFLCFPTLTVKSIEREEPRDPQQSPPPLEPGDGQPDEQGKEARGVRTCDTCSAQSNQMMRPSTPPAVRGRISPPAPLFFPRPRVPHQHISIYYIGNDNQEEEGSAVRPNRGNSNPVDDDVLR